MALFGPTVTRAQSQNLLEFRAGKMQLRGNMVHPDKRKGLIYIYQSEDALMHFCWKDRATGKLEEDFIVFPDDASFTAVPQCTTGRVFLLRIRPNRKFFFWMQEPKSDKDQDFCSKVNEFLNHPPAPGSARPSGSRAATGTGGAADSVSLADSLSGWGGGAVDGDMIQNALGNMDHNQLYQLLNLMGAGSGGGALDPSALLSGLSAQSRPATGSDSTTTPVASTAASTQRVSASATSASGSTTEGAPRRQVVNLAQLQDIMSNIKVPTSAATSEAEAPLEEVLTADKIPFATLNSDSLNRLLPHLPYDPSIDQGNILQELLTNVRSPQFRQAVGMFGNGLQTGQLGPLLKQFDLPQGAVDAANRGDIQSFAEILQSSEKNTSEDSSSTSAKGSSEKDKDTEKTTAKKDGEKSGKVGEESDEIREPPSKKDKPDDEGMDLD